MILFKEKQRNGERKGEGEEQSQSDTGRPGYIDQPGTHCTHTHTHTLCTHPL